MATSKSAKEKNRERVYAFRDRMESAGGRRVDVFLSANATAALDRWKAHTGAPSDTQAIKLAILAAAMQARGK